ncbi:MAG: cytochrome c3 family protein [Mycobacterium leprae]
MQREIRNFLIGLGVVIGILVVVGGYTYLTGYGPEVLASGPNLADQCGTCHSMDKEVASWQDSSHKNVPCMACHVEGDPAQVREQLAAHKTDMAAASTTAPAKPLEMKVENQRCLDCHQPQMDSLLKDISPKPLTATANPNQGKALPVNAAHSAHLNDAKITCVDCHASSAHGAKAGTQAAMDEAHDLCQSCHTQKQVTLKVTGDVSCAACHANPVSVAPTDHQNTTQWRQAHGKASQTQNCGQCHLSTSAGPKSTLSQSSSFAGDGKDACQACHGTTMPHPQNWLASHNAAYQANPAVCVNCHSGSTPGDKPAATVSPTVLPNTGICLDCHKVEMPHGADYLAIHGEKAMANPDGTCTTCHSGMNPVTTTTEYASNDYCSNCHAGETMPHRPTFLSTHGQQALSNPATCEACHSSKNPAQPTADHASGSFCAACHGTYNHPAGWVAGHGTKVTDACYTCHTKTGVPGDQKACSSCHKADGTWHPDLWYVTHAREIDNQGGKAACLRCHNEVKPSCSQCHKEQ